jgi:hypothetical protein
MLSVVYAECHILARYAECHYAECHYAACRGTITAALGDSATVSSF